MSQQQTAPHSSGHTSNKPLDQRSSANWNAFMRSVTYAACAIIAVLIVMAIFLT